MKKIILLACSLLGYLLLFVPLFIFYLSPEEHGELFEIYLLYSWPLVFFMGSWHFILLYKGGEVTRDKIKQK
jgi:hypothetical protein